MRRFLSGCVGVLFLLTAPATVAWAAAEGSVTASTTGWDSTGRATSATTCATAAAATFTHTFSGTAGTAAVTAARPLCAGQRQRFTLVSYTSSAATRRQFRYATDVATIDARHPTATLTVQVPACRAHVYLIVGTGVRDEIPETGYGTEVLGSPDGTGSRSTGPLGTYGREGAPCVPKPSVTYDNGCDGSLRARLGNDADANVDAIFVVGSSPVRVAPGQSVTTAARMTTMSIRDNTFTTHIGAWTRPAGCVALAAPATTTPSPATSTGTPRPSATSAIEQDPVRFEGADVTAPRAGIAATPAVAHPAAAAKPRGDADSDSLGLGSMLIFVVGGLMMAGGTAVLVRVIGAARRG